MATRTWIGGAQNISQVQTYVIDGTWEATDIIKFTMGTVTATVVAGSTNTTTIATTMATAWNALSSTVYPQFAELTAGSSTNNFTLTADTAGNAFSCTISSVETNGGASDGQTIDSVASPTTSPGTTTTANSNPNDWSVAGNWAENAVPTSSDDVVFDAGNKDVLDGLAQSGVTLTSLSVRAAYTGKIGRPTLNAAGYYEYRATQLAVSATTITIGQGNGTGSGRIKLNVGTAQTAVTVHKMATTVESGLAAFLFKGTHASNVMNVYGGSVGVATFSGETAVIATLRQTGGTIVCQSGVTLTTIDKNGGTLETHSAATTVTNRGGDLQLWSGAHTTINLLEGALSYNSTGTITTLNVYDGGEANFDSVNQSRTVTNTNIVAGAKISDKAKTVTWTNPISLAKCGIEAVTLMLGEDITVARG